MSVWYVYIVRCADDTLYTGVALDPVRRVEEHNNNNRLAARYTRARRPVKLVYHEKVASRADALSREYAIKKLARHQKEKMLEADG